MIDRVCSLLKIKKPAATAGYLFDSGATVPGAVSGYKTGALFQHTDGGAGTAVYVNEGDATTASFQAISGLTAAQEALLGATAGSGAASKALILDANKTSRIGDWVGAGAPGSAVVFSAALNKYSDGQLDIFSVFGESTSDLTSADSAKCGRFRHLVTGSSTTIAHETYGLAGQLVGKSVTLTHLHAGLLGTLEANTTAVVANSAYAYGVAAVIGRVGGTNLITATKPVCGFSAVHNGADLASGVSVAFAACATSTGNWTYLLAADNCDYLFYASTGTNNENGCKLATVTLGATGDGTLRIKINATEYFIPFYAAGSISGE